MKRISKKARVMISVVGLLMLAVLLISLLNLSENESWTDALIKILIGMIIPAITLLTVYLFNIFIGTEDIEDEHDKDIMRRIWSLLRAERSEDSIIKQLYDRDSAYTVMRNSVSYFSSRLSESFCRMVSNERMVIRENQVYKVKIFLNSRNGLYSLRQNVKYTRHFNRSEDGQRDVFLKCCFTFDANTLRDAFRDDTLFFREVLDDESLISEITELMSSGKEREVLNRLNYKLTVFDLMGNEKTVQNDQITVESLKNPRTGKLTGVVFTYTFPVADDGKPMYISDSLDGKVSYTASIGCHYPIPNMSRFLCVFSNPVIGRTMFSIEFDDDIIDNAADDVQIDSFLTTPCLNAQQIRYPDPYEIQFETQETIFPTSAIVTQWRAKSREKLCHRPDRNLNLRD